MTETEWLNGSDPGAMVRYVLGRVSSRKLRLFGCACLRRAWDLLIDERSRNAVEVAERFAEGLASEDELAATFAGSCHAARLLTGLPDMDHRQIALALAAWEAANLADGHLGQDWASDRCRMAASVRAFEEVSSDYDTVAIRGVSERECHAQCRLLREIIGNPFHPVTIDPIWRTTTVVDPAQGIFAEQAYERMPILADALEEAGCEHADMLKHCREETGHVRGCWVIDALLEKDRPRRKRQ